jgi:hypothetical protein
MYFLSTALTETSQSYGGMQCQIQDVGYLMAGRAPLLSLAQWARKL